MGPQDCYCGSEKQLPLLLGCYGNTNVSACGCDHATSAGAGGGLGGVTSGTYGFAVAGRRKGGLWDAMRPP